MMKIKLTSPFHSKSILSNIRDLSIADISQEKGIFSCSPDWVVENGTPLIKAMTEEIIADIETHQSMAPDHYPVIDVRVQRLMPGMYPSIPGWHCDAIPRDSYYGQPDFTQVNKNVRHIVGTFSTHPHGVSNTIFLDGDQEVDLDPELGSIYNQMHNELEGSDNLSTLRLDDSIWEIFDSLSAHKAAPTINRGWRIFYRASMLLTPALNDPSLKNFEQVYILSEANGW